MGKEIHFVTLYPNCPNYGLVKDVGQIPYTLNKIDGINAAIASAYIDEKGEHTQYLNNMMLYNLGRKNQFLEGCLFIFKYAKKIDWLNFFHGGRKCYYWTKLYKFLNHSGKVYLKMDLSYDGCKKYSENEREKKIFIKTARVADIVSVECKKICSLVKEITGIDVEWIPNGYIDVDEKGIKSIKRQNAFITVGRLGTPEKATDILLEAFASSASKHDWVLKLVGPIEETFYTYINNYFRKYPELKERVIFTGAINDRVKLYEEYRTARVFVLPSRWEGSPLVGPEALYNGCRMILSDSIPPIEELTNGLQYGSVVKNESIDSLASALVKEADRNYSEDEHMSITRYARENLLWDVIAMRLYELMQNKMVLETK